jgi:hypothetical protein
MFSRRRFVASSLAVVRAGFEGWMAVVEMVDVRHLNKMVLNLTKV